MNDHGSRRYVDELGALHVLLRDYPMKSNIAWVQVAVDAAGAAVIEVQLAARRLPDLAAGLIEWHRTLSNPTGAIWRLGDDTARVVVSGVADESRTPVLVVGGPVPYRQLVGVRAAEGKKTAFDTDHLYLWAIDLNTDPDGGEVR